MPVRLLLLVVCLAVLFGQISGALAGERPPGSYFLDQFHRVDVLAKPIDLADVALATPEGDLRVSDWHGKWVIFNIWATWCPPCVRELSSLSRLRYLKAGRGVEVVAVSVDRKMDAGRIAYFLKRYRAPNLTALYDAGRVLSDQVDTGMLPVTYILNPDGVAVAALYGPAAWESVHAQAFIDALRQNPDLLARYVKQDKVP